MNCYFVSIFACCRENFLPHKHTNCVEAKSIAEAEKIIEQKNKQKAEEEEQKRTVEEENIVLKKKIEELKRQVNDFG